MEDVKDQAVAEQATALFLPEGFSVGSRIVTVRSADRSIFLPKSKDIRKEVVNKISSSWKEGTNDIVRGLERSAKYYDQNGNIKIVNEEKIYLPGVVGLNDDADAWEETVKQYWAEYTIKVPLEEGVDFEIGFTEDGRPIDIKGYIGYKFCRETGYVAVRPEEVANKFSEIFLFFVVDKYEEQQKERERFKFMQDVNAKFYALTSSSVESEVAKIDYILTLIGGEENDGMYINNMDNTEKLMALEKVKNSVPELFIKYVDDKNLTHKTLLRRAVNSGIITKEGNAYFMMDQRIGSSEMEAVAYLSDPNNGGARQKLIEKIKAAYK
jgi:hypothetical protein